MKRYKHHICEEMKQSKDGHFGPAIADIFFDPSEQAWAASAGINEYYSSIIYCPFCGIRLPLKMETP